MNILTESEKLEARKIQIKEMLEAQEVALKYKNPRVCCMLARSGEEFLDLDKLQKALIETKDAKHCYLLAKHSSWADIDALQDVVIEYGEDYYLLAFAENVGDADVRRLSRALADRGNYKYLLKLAVKMPDKIDVEYVQNFILKSDNMSDLLLFAANVKDANYDLLLDRVIEKRDSYICFKFIVEFPWINVKKAEKALVEWGSPVWCYKLVKHIPGVNKEELIQSIMLKHDLQYAMKSIAYAEGIQKLQLLYFIANSKNCQICQEALSLYDLDEKERQILIDGIIDAENFSKEFIVQEDIEDKRELFN